MGSNRMGCWTRPGNSLSLGVQELLVDCVSRVSLDSLFLNRDGRKLSVILQCVFHSFLLQLKYMCNSVTCFYWKFPLEMGLQARWILSLEPKCRYNCAFEANVSFLLFFVVFPRFHSVRHCSRPMYIGKN